jgi:XapX domain-containing protein
MKVALGFGVAVGLGFVCRAFGIPSPAPPVLTGALLVLAMTCGYVLVDRFVAHQPARHARNCAGPTGRIPSGDPSGARAANTSTPSDET